MQGNHVRLNINLTNLIHTIVRKVHMFIQTLS
jgi:hypothetical protein